ncbi:MAG: hypothetical protein HY787_08165 [Deltaproteobacteria bacterium]|nr:hypothetical protein [Deltaproteobacteria bacterium]
MEDKKGYSFELQEDMLSLIEKEFSPQEIADSLAAAIEGKSSPEIPEIGKRIFSEQGRRWAARVLELGESYLDRTYEVLREAIDTTGSPAFPLIPQRFVEIAYLSTQKISTLPIVENNMARLIYRIGDCRTYQAISDRLGPETAGLLVCRQGCLNLCQGIMEGLSLEGIETEMSAKRPEQGYCQFIINNTKA